MNIKDLEIKTCKWCYVVYFIENDYQHNLCKKKRSKVLRNINNTNKQNKYFEYKN
jgi:hypothetical protein